MSKARNVFNKFCITSLCLSALIFAASILISDTWFTELTISLTTLHCISTIALVLMLSFLKNRSWVIFGLVLLVSQGAFIANTYINATPFVDDPSIQYSPSQRRWQENRRLD